MTKIDLQPAKAEILEKLRRAGDKGLPKSKLPLTSGVRKQAFEELVKAREIANLGSPARTCLVLIEHFRPLEIACDLILEKFPQRALTLRSRSKLGEGIKGAIGGKVDEAVDWLVKDGKLLKVKHGVATYYLSVEAVLAELPYAWVKEPAEESADLETRVMAAYGKVKQRIGFSDVEIFDLQQESGIPMDRLKAFLMDKSREGRAVLSQGDWSLSSDKVRSGAIELHGLAHLMVRFK